MFIITNGRIYPHHTCYIYLLPYSVKSIDSLAVCVIMLTVLIDSADWQCWLTVLIDSQHEEPIQLSAWLTAQRMLIESFALCRSTPTKKNSIHNMWKKISDMFKKNILFHLNNIYFTYSYTLYMGVDSIDRTFTKLLLNSFFVCRFSGHSQRKALFVYRLIGARLIGIFLMISS